MLALALMLVAGVAAVLVIAGSPDLVVSFSLASAHASMIGRDSFVYAGDGSRLGAVPTTRNREPAALERMSHWAAASDGRDRGPALLGSRGARLRGDRAGCDRGSEGGPNRPGRLDDRATVRA
jgi:hypothetical protein